MIKTMNKLMRMGLVVLIGMSAMSVMTSCSKDDDEKEDNKEEQLYVRPWVDYPQSYIKFFDYRMSFRLLNVQRNGSALQVDYVLTNTSFGGEVQLSFAVERTTAARDDLGNTYNYTGFSGGHGTVIARLDGKQLSPAGTLVSFMPNQATRGSITIQNFDINAAAVSFSASVSVVSPRDITLAYNRIDFVNIPVDAKDNDGSYQNM